MRRYALPTFAALFAGCLSGCTGTGVFLDHTFQSFGSVPNSPAGNSETFLRIRGEDVTLLPLLPEPGNVWPTDNKPDPTLQDLEKQQADEIRRGGGNAGAPPSPGQNPAVNRANNADRGLPPPNLLPPPPARLRSPTVNTRMDRPWT